MQPASPDRDRIVVIAGGLQAHDPDQLLALLDELDPTIVLRSKLSGANATAFGWAKARGREMHEIPEAGISGQLAALLAHASVVVLAFGVDDEDDGQAVVREAERLGVSVITMN